MAKKKKITVKKTEKKVVAENVIVNDMPGVSIAKEVSEIKCSRCNGVMHIVKQSGPVKEYKCSTCSAEISIM